MTIPKIIHQTWKTSEMPAAISRCVDSIRKRNTGWSHILHTDADWEAIVKSQNLLSWEEFLRYPTGIQKADIFRCIALYEQGGVYADVDTLALRPLDSLINSAVESGLIEEDTEMILTTDHPVHSQLIWGGGEILMNNFMVAKPRARFMKLYLEYIKDFVSAGYKGKTEPVTTTGPVAMSRLVEDFGGAEELKIAVVPFFWVNPLPDMTLHFPGKSAFQEIIEDGSWRARFCPYVVHLWWHSYWSEHSMLKIYESLLSAAGPGAKALRRPVQTGSIKAGEEETPEAVA
jgi:inositol phosphorylceramide mannosyltransferase catalytic subunit